MTRHPRPHCDDGSPRCQESVPDVSGFHRFQCTNRAKYGPFCGIHSPEKKAERAAKRPPTDFERRLARAQREADERDALEEVLLYARRLLNEEGRFPHHDLREAIKKCDSITQKG